MARTDISICNRALMGLGSAPLNSFDTPSDTGKFLKIAYPEIRAMVASAYMWECMKTIKPLTLEAGTPVGFGYSFIMPGDMVGAPIAVYWTPAPWQRGTNGFEIRGRRILSNYQQLWVEYSVIKPEADWPSWYAELMVGAVASEIAYMVTDQQSVKDYWEGKTYGSPSENRVGGLMGQAMTLDAQGSGNNPGLADNAFIDARFGAVYPGDQN